MQDSIAAGDSESAVKFCGGLYACIRDWPYSRLGKVGMVLAARFIDDRQPVLQRKFSLAGELHLFVAKLS